LKWKHISTLFPLQSGDPLQAEIKWKRRGNKQETHFRFISYSRRFEKSVGGIVSGDWKGPISRFSIWTFVGIKINARSDEQTWRQENARRNAENQATSPVFTIPSISVFF
jgi:hypothetical protein